MSLTDGEALGLFAQQAARPDDSIDLAEAALLVAHEAWPALDRGLYHARLGRLALRLRDRLAAEGASAPWPAAAVAGALAGLLGVETGLRGNAAEYYDPQNSYLNAVMDRALGLPITLSVVYLEVAWRAGCRAEGIGFPGHFLVGLPGPDGPQFVDPFHGGRRVGAADWGGLLRGPLGPDAELKPEYLLPVTRRQILHRLLNNLKAIHSRAADLERAHRACDWIVTLLPTSPEERRDRGLLRVQLGRPADALPDLAFYLERRPAAADRDPVERALEQVRRELARWN